MTEKRSGKPQNGSSAGQPQTPAGDIDTAAGTDPKRLDSGDDVSDGADEMTAAELSGQVAYGGKEPGGETGATGAGGSSG